MDEQVLDPQRKSLAAARQPEFKRSLVERGIEIN